ncbi:hypothetical protein FB451DRAFT_1172597 [Mycena latifolia]|nr:hypothetical protein FB451DRAFT_1172597 [Mycena latifolia]
MWNEGLIALEYATLSERRGFLGYAYSSPFALHSEHIRADDLQKLIQTARFTQIYKIKSFLRWAQRMLTHLVSRGRCSASGVPHIDLIELYHESPIPSFRALQDIAYCAQLKELDASMDPADFAVVSLSDRHKLRLIRKN